MLNSICDSVGECGALTNPTNGQVSHPNRTTEGQTATYSCNTGYNLEGDSIRTCQATGVWSGSEPTCQSKHMSSSLFQMCFGIITSCFLI